MLNKLYYQGFYNIAINDVNPDLVVISNEAKKYTSKNNFFLGGRAPGKNDNLTSIRTNNNPIIDVNDKSSNVYDINSNKTLSSNQSKITVNIVKNFNEILSKITGNYIILKAKKPILLKRNKNKQGGKKNKKYNFLKLVKTKKYKKSKKSGKSKKNRKSKKSTRKR